VDDGVGGGQVETDAAGFQADQEDRHFAVLELVDRRFAVAGVAGQGGVAEAVLVELGGDQFEHAGEL